MLKNWLKLLNKFLSTRVDLFDREKLEDLGKKKENIKDNLGDFFQEEKREVTELLDGKQNWKKYCQDSSALFKDYFIPHDGNDNKPKILRPKQLTIIALLLLLLKVSLVGYLFSVYQREAEMSETTISQILVLTNESRVANGVSALNLNPALSKAAQIKAEDMTVNNYFSHTSIDGRKPWDFVNRGEYAYILIGENLAMNFIAASDAHSALMASPSHQKNILNPKYTDIGLAVVSGKIDGEETNVLVEMFGAKAQAVAPAPVVVNTVKEEVSAPVQPATTTEKTETANISPNPAAVSPVIVKAVPEKTTVASVNTPATQPVATIAQSDTTTTSENENNVVLVEKTSENLSANSAVQDSLLLPLLETVATQTPNTPTEEINQVVSEVSNSNTPELINDEPLLEEPVYATSVQNQKINTAAKVMRISKIVYVFFLLFLIIALIINIVIRIRIQHKSIIFPAILLIILIIALLVYDFGFMKELREAAVNLVVL